MAVLVYLDNSNGKIPKSGLEAAYFAAKLAEGQNTESTALVIGNPDDQELIHLGRYGINKVLKVNEPHLERFASGAFTKTLEHAILETAADIVVMVHNANGKALAPMLAAKMKAGLISSVVDFPLIENGTMTVKRSVYSGKAFHFVSTSAEKKILTLQSNSFSPETQEGKAEVQAFGSGTTDADVKVDVKEVLKVTDKVPLSEASVIVSGGRGMKGPENWHLLETLADLLGGTVACSKPVSDMGWRPHAEHVGQTGLSVRPDLYVAVGISGAIQHLAGVNGSKYIVAVNTDKEAPIFNAADYGIVGDAFDVMPKIIDAVKKLLG